jgi:hypothetical protein
MANAAHGAAPAAQRADRWILEVSLGKCHLARDLTAVHAALSIETQVGTDSYTLVVADEKVGRLPSPIAEVAIKVDGRDVAATYANLAKVSGTPSMQAWMPGLDGGIVEAVGSGKALSIAPKRGTRIGPLPLPDAANAVAALRRCEAEQLIEWGADPAQFAPGGSRPKVGDRMQLVPQSVVQKIRFPKGPIEPLHYLVLSDQGVVESCASVFGIPGSDFEQIVCGHLRGRRIGEPARDAGGKAVRGVVALTPALIRRATY